MIVLVGAGSIGGFLAWQLARSGSSPILCTRTPFDTLVVEDAAGAHAVELPVLTEASRVPEAEWVLLTTKAHQTPDAAAWLRGACGPSTRAVVVLQNGVEQVERVAPFVDGTPILPAVVNIAAEAVSPGRIRHHAYARLEVPAGALGRAFAALFDRSDVTVGLADDFVTTVWRKLIANVTASPITALTGRRIDVMAEPSVRSLATRLAEECIAVANAAGAVIPAEDAGRLVEAMAADATSTSWTFGSSMLYDRLAGRPTEHEALTGAVVRIGERLGVPTPLNAAILALLRGASGS
jgi:2-dehydropantoate 2-reductase